MPCTIQKTSLRDYSVQVVSHAFCYPDWVRLYCQMFHRMWQTACFLQKTNNYFKIFVVIKRKEPMCLSHRFEAATIHLSQLEILFVIQLPFSGSQNMFPWLFKSFVMANPRETVTFHEKSGQENTFWMLPAIPDVTLISWNGSVRYLFPEK